MENFNGFASINREPLATISHNHLFWQKGALQGGGYGEGKFSINTQLETKIAVVKINAEPAVSLFKIKPRISVPKKSVIIKISLIFKNLCKSVIICGQ